MVVNKLHIGKPQNYTYDKIIFKLMVNSHVSKQGCILLYIDPLFKGKYKTW